MEARRRDGRKLAHHPSVHGPAAIAEYFRSVFAARRLAFTFTGSSVTLLGDVALERLTFGIVATSVTGGLEAEDVGKGLHACTRQPGGRWRIAQDIWNSDRPWVAAIADTGLLAHDT